MVTRMTQIMGLIVAVALLVAALWGWGQAARIADNAHRPELAIWAVRSAATAAAAGAQVLVLTFVVGAVFRRRSSDELLRVGAASICTLALVAAFVLTFVGK